MGQNLKAVAKIISEFEKEKLIQAYSNQLAPLSEDEINHLEQSDFHKEFDKQGVFNRIEFLHQRNINFEYVTGKKQFSEPETLKGNIEHFIGMAQIPIGLAGPILIHGTKANGEFYIPLATTEGAMISSYHRGMKAIRASGGVTSVCISEGTQRSPFFKFNNIGEVGIFIKFILENSHKFDEIVSQSSRFAKLIDLKINIEGNSVIVTFEYTTGDASGQNMVTICTDNICQYILSNFEVKPVEWYIESNYSGDKKATNLSFANVRGKKVTSEIVLPTRIIERILKSTPEKIQKYWQSSTLGVIQSGAIGAQGHVANGLAAIFIACGQDVACISESSVGITRMELNAEGNLYVAVTLPSIIVGTVGGGTKLPTQTECLNMLGCNGIGHARKFAEICGAVALAGEISIAAAMSANHFTRAHQLFGRKKHE